jgi:hypothetical protein
MTAFPKDRSTIRENNKIVLERAAYCHTCSTAASRTTRDVCRGTYTAERFLARAANRILSHSTGKRLQPESRENRDRRLSKLAALRSGSRACVGTANQFLSG